MLKKYLSLLLILLMLLTVAGNAAGADTIVTSDSEQPYKAVQVAVEEEADMTLHDVPDSKYFSVKPPAIFSSYTKPENGIVKGDIYVSPQGNDQTGDGSFERPFATISRARDQIRVMKAQNGLPNGGLTVSIMAGRYQMAEPIKFYSEDSGTEDCPITYTAYGDGEVLFTGGTPLDADDFTEIGDDVKEILTEEAGKNVRMIDLKKYGIKSDMLTLNPIGRGGNAEFYCNRENYQLARYLSENEFSYTRNVVNGNVFEMRRSDFERVKSWSSHSDIWVLGMFYYEYKDDTSRVTFDLDKGTFTGNFYTEYDSASYRYFFYNVLDELDEPGEWYLDRKNCIMYVYPKTDINKAELDLVINYSDYFINVSSCEYLTIKGLTFMGTKGSALSAHNVAHFSLLNCNFGEIGGNAVSASGSNNLIQGCEIKYIGGNGIELGGGDKNSLQKAYNVIDNNYVSHWGLNSRVFTTAIETYGQGNTISHNEVAYSTSNSLGISGGNNNIVEYNLLHDCTSYADDCGSFYTGSSWTSGGNILRYNCFYNIGSDEVKPSAVYWDDGMAYQIAYGNLFVNISGYALSMGGGFGNTVVNNVIINTGKSPFLYDDRPYSGYKTGNEFYQLGGFLWRIYKNTPYNDINWRKYFPLLSQILQDEKDTFAPHFAFNPAFSLFSDNIYVTNYGYNGAVAIVNPAYSTQVDCYACRITEMDKLFVDPSRGDYRISEDSDVWDTVSDFEPIPYNEIGRY